MGEMPCAAYEFCKSRAAPLRQRVLPREAVSLSAPITPHGGGRDRVVRGS